MNEEIAIFRDNHFAGRAQVTLQDGRSSVEITRGMAYEGESRPAGVRGRHDRGGGEGGVIRLLVQLAAGWGWCRGCYR